MIEIETSDITDQGITNTVHSVDCTVCTSRVQTLNENDNERQQLLSYLLLKRKAFQQPIQMAENFYYHSKGLDASSLLVK